MRNTPTVFFHSGLNGMPGLSSISPPTLPGNAVYARCFQAKVILDGPKETGYLPRHDAYSFDIMYR
jgi:hypothetical protein